jgi:hypothetical protein
MQYFSTAPIRLDLSDICVHRIRYRPDGTRKRKIIRRDVHRDVCVEIPKQAKCCQGKNGDAWVVPMATRRRGDLVEVLMWDCASGNHEHVHTCAVIEEKSLHAEGKADIFLRAVF